MTERNRLHRAWPTSGLIGFAFWVASSAVGLELLIVPGLIFLGWGLAISTNGRGAADAMPRKSGIGPFWTTTSPAMIRLVFGFFAVFGAVLLIAGIVALARSA